MPSPSLKSEYSLSSSRLSSSSLSSSEASSGSPAATFGTATPSNAANSLAASFALCLACSATAALSFALPSARRHWGSLLLAESFKSSASLRKSSASSKSRRASCSFALDSSAFSLADFRRASNSLRRAFAEEAATSASAAASPATLILSATLLSKSARERFLSTVVDRLGALAINSASDASESESEEVNRFSPGALLRAPSLRSCGDLRRPLLSEPSSRA
mmetsp:Transcript_122881/g.342773  ORF Transcript_122881/g.342773 Transcript_122881/m.342773 type:complete len:221 (+) Transcript_122881:321-983(+)